MDSTTITPLHSRLRACHFGGMLLLLIGLCTGCSSLQKNPAQKPEPSAFVSVQGKHFFRHQKPYYIAGANMWYGAFLGAPQQAAKRQRLVQELDILQQQGINNLRILAAGERSSLSRAVDEAIIEKPGQYNENLLIGLDFLLAEMAKRNMTAVLYLANFWQWSGGMSQYVAWFTGRPAFDPDITGDWGTFMESSAQFYRIPEAQQEYRRYIQHLIQRRNSITGVPYAQDPTIMSWQLANEPRAGSDEKGHKHAAIYVDWIASTAAYIRSLAPHQLISSGSEGLKGSLMDMALFKKAHAIANMDYLTVHMWAKNWGWFDPKNPQATYPRAWAAAKDYMDQHIQAANDLGKPMVLEEFGLDRDGGSFSPSASTHYRDQYYQAVFAHLHKSAAAGSAVAGFNYWAWGGLARSPRSDFIWRPGDDLMGDPPQEPQGLNVVFASDASTLQVIKTAAQAFTSLAPARALPQH
jgi:mannan endo-1,4-beta-mannosidase